MRLTERRSAIKISFCLLVYFIHERFIAVEITEKYEKLRTSTFFKQTHPLSHIVGIATSDGVSRTCSYFAQYFYFVMFRKFCVKKSLKIRLWSV